MKRSLLTLLYVMLLFGCELFTPRDSEPPIDISSPYIWKPPTSQEIVLENLSNAFPAHQVNYYLDVLSYNPELGTEVRLIPDESVRSSQPDVFDVWGFPEEEKFITKLFQSLSEDGLQRLEWDVEQSSLIDNKFIADYSLTLSYRESETPMPGQLKGQAILTLTQNPDLLYEISIWQDIKSDTLPCWSDLKTLVQ